jgi:Leucine-rich repeat (LRR) protein
MEVLSKLRYVNMAQNNMSGNITIFKAAKNLEGVDFSGNQF